MKFLFSTTSPIKKSDDLLLWSPKGYTVLWIFLPVQSITCCNLWTTTFVCNFLDSSQIRWICSRDPTDFFTTRFPIFTVWSLIKPGACWLILSLNGTCTRKNFSEELLSIGAYVEMFLCVIVCDPKRIYDVRNMRVFCVKVLRHLPYILKEIGYANAWMAKNSRYR